MKQNQLWRRLSRLVCGLGALLLLACGAVSAVGCGEEKKDNCSSNLDCDAEQACVTVDGVKSCIAKGAEGDACDDNGAGGKPPCIQRDSDGREIICDNAVCKVKCQTDLDCDTKEEKCDTATGRCAVPSAP